MHGDVRAARQAAVGDADERLGQLDPAGGLVAVEAGAVPGGDRGAEDGERELGRRRRGAGAAADRARGCGTGRCWRAFQRATNVPSRLDRRLGLLRPRLGDGVEVTGRRPCGRRASRRRRRGSGPSCRAARCRRRRAGTARARRGGRLGAAGRRLRERARRDRPRMRRSARRSESSGSHGFLRCLRGELTGSRRESSATAGSPADSPPRTTDPHWVPRSPGWKPADSARGNVAAARAWGACRPRA